MTAPDGKIRIPLNEEGKDGGGQIEEYLRDYNGEGIQHIAFGMRRPLRHCRTALKATAARRSPRPRPTPITRCSTSACRAMASRSTSCSARGILLDGSTEDGDPRLLLQIFSAERHRPGVLRVHPAQEATKASAKATSPLLFKSIEADQIRRGALKVRETAE